jgi:hypothetical protein
MPTRVGTACGREFTSPWPSGPTSLSLVLVLTTSYVCTTSTMAFPLGLAMITASLRAIGIALCHLATWLWCPMSWFGSWIVPLFVQPSSIPWWVGRRSVGSTLSSSSLVLNPRRSSKMWIEPLACLVFVALWFHFLDFRRCYGEWIRGRWILCLFLSFGFVVPKPLYACTIFDRNISLVLAVTTAPLRTWEMSSAFSAPRSWYPTSLSGTLVSFYVSFPSMPRLLPWRVYWKK